MVFVNEKTKIACCITYSISLGEYPIAWYLSKILLQACDVSSSIASASLVYLKS